MVGGGSGAVPVVEAITLLVVTALSLAAALMLTRWVYYHALRSNIMDLPNARSSHSVATPRGGGLSMVVVFSVGTIVLFLLGMVDARTLLAVVPPSVGVAAAGYVDDRRGLAPVLRLAVHMVSVAVFLFCLGELPPLGIDWIDSLPAVSWLITFFALIWLLNLFNFMDGVDGMAGLEMVYVCFSLALMGWLSGSSQGFLLLTCVLGASAMGFLFWNWSPARIFMGDVGSGFAGIVIGMLCVIAMHESKICAAAPVILLGTFIADSTFTLVRRMFRGERWYDAHRSHAYQWLGRRLGSHRAVVLIYFAINVGWLFPLSLLALRFPSRAWLIATVAYCPLIVAAYLGGAGRPEGGTAVRVQSSS